MEAATTAWLRARLFSASKKRRRSPLGSRLRPFPLCGWFFLWISCGRPVQTVQDPASFRWNELFLGLRRVFHLQVVLHGKHSRNSVGANAGHVLVALVIDQT